MWEKNFYNRKYFAKAKIRDMITILVSRRELELEQSEPCSLSPILHLRSPWTGWRRPVTNECREVNMGMWRLWCASCLRLPGSTWGCGDCVVPAV